MCQLLRVKEEQEQDIRYPKTRSSLAVDHRVSVSLFLWFTPVWSVLLFHFCYSPSNAFSCLCITWMRKLLVSLTATDENGVRCFVSRFVSCLFAFPFPSLPFLPVTRFHAVFQALYVSPSLPLFSSSWDSGAFGSGVRGYSMPVEQEASQNKRIAK